jgi:hypothetical protein
MHSSSYSMPIGCGQAASRRRAIRGLRFVGQVDDCRAKDRLIAVEENAAGNAQLLPVAQIPMSGSIFRLSQIADR